MIRDRERAELSSGDRRRAPARKLRSERAFNDEGLPRSEHLETTCPERQAEDDFTGLCEEADTERIVHINFVAHGFPFLVFRIIDEGFRLTDFRVATRIRRKDVCENERHELHRRRWDEASAAGVVECLRLDATDDASNSLNRVWTEAAHNIVANGSSR